MGFWFTFFMWAASFVIGDYFRPRLPSRTPAGLGDFSIPTATEGRYIPVMTGTLQVVAPNCVWYGDYSVQQRTVETGVIFTRDETIGYTYFLAFQYAQVHNEVAGITGVWIGDDKVYEGVATDVVDINRPDLFGGQDNGGGFIGRIRLFPGSQNQAVSSFLASHLDPLPAFRGTAYVMITDISETTGANIGESNQLREIRLELQAFDTVANGALGDVLQLGNDHHFIGADINPISFAYEVYTNNDWGGGRPPSDFNLTNFQEAAETLYSEGLGFSRLYDDVLDAEDVIDEIEQHIDGYIGPNPLTGLMEVNLARSGYTLADEFQADESNIIAVPKWSKSDWNQTKNELRLQYADRAKSYKDTFAKAQSLSNRIIQGKPATEDFRMPGVHTATVANAIVWRTAKSRFRALTTGTIELDRQAFRLRPGDVLSFTDADNEETDLPVRVIKIAKGDLSSLGITVDVVEDVFGVETVGSSAPPASDFVPPVQSVGPLDAEDQFAVEAPYIITRQDPISPNVGGRLLTMARITTGSPIEYEIRRRDPGGSGSYVSSTFIRNGFATVGTLRNDEVGPLAGNGAKTIQIDPVEGSLDGIIGLKSPGSGNMSGIAVINPGTDDEEWVIFDEIVDDLSGIRLEGVWRGALDTAQKPHSAGERIWFIANGGVGLTAEAFALSASIDVKLLPRSPTDAVDEADAIAITPVNFMSGYSRYYRPLLPANVLVGSSADFDGVLTVVGSVIEYQGIRLSPRLRDWRNQNPLDQVQGGGIRSDIWGDDEHQIQYWIYNLQTDPTPNRGDAIFNATASAQFATSGVIDVLKDDVAAEFEAASTNSLPMRLEVETSHIPGAGASRIVSRDVMIMDFTGTGTFSVPFGSVFVHMDFELGITGDVLVRDLSANQHVLKPANSDIGVDSTVSAPIGTRAYRLDNDNPDTFPVNSSGYIVIPTTGPVTGDLDFDQDFTIEIRLRFSSVSSNMEILGTFGTSTAGSGMYLEKLANDGAFRLMFSTDADGAVEQTVTLTEDSGFTPVVDQWYAIMVTKKVETNGTFTFRLLRDGNRVSSINVPGFVTGPGNVNSFALGASDVNRPPSSSVTGSGFKGYVDEFRFLQGVALEVVDYTVPVVAADAESADYLVMMSNFEGEAGTDTAKLAEDLASSDTAWVYDGTTDQCRISGNKAKFGNTSLYVDGTNDAGLRWGNFETEDQIGHQDLLAFDWTIEGWVNFDSLPSSKANGMALAGKGDNGGNERSWFFGFDENDELEFVFYEQGAGSVEIGETSSGLAALSTDQWYHIAVCRNGDAIEAWVDGTRVINNASFFDDGGTPYQINSNTIATSIGKAFRDEVGDLHRSLDGYVDSFRLIKRAAIYTGASITVPTAAFPGPTPVAAGSKIAKQAQLYYHNHFNWEDAAYDPHWDKVDVLLDMEGSDAATSADDDGGLALTWTFSGNAQLDTAQAAIGSSSLLLDGTGDYISAGDVDALEFGTGAFTVEAFVRFNGSPAGGGDQVIASKWNTASNQRDWRLWFDDSDDHLAFDWSSNGTAVSHVSAAWSPSADTWYHIAVSSDGQDVALFIDGVQVLSSTNNTSIDQSNTAEVWIGAQQDGGGSSFFDGWIDGVRITNGAARYNPRVSLDFPVPAAAYARKSGYEFTQDHSSNATELQAVVGNPIADTSEHKFGTASLYLDGSSYVQLDANGPALLANSFSIEAQVQFDGDPGTGNATILSAWDTAGDDQGWILALRNNALVFEWNDGATDFEITGAWNPADATWYHVMVSKVQGMLRLFVDGVQVGTAYEVDLLDRSIDDAAEPMRVGTHFEAGVATDNLTGWVDEVRVLVSESAENGYDFPVASFTAPADEYDWHRAISHIGDDRNLSRLGYAIDKSAMQHTVTPTNVVPFDLVRRFATVDESRGGGFSKTLDFYSAISYLEVVYQDGMQLGNNDFTIEAWVYFDQTSPTTETMAIASHYEATGNNRSWFLRYDSTLDGLAFGWYPDGSTISQAYFDWSGVALDTWYHVAVTREGDTLRFFLDGVLQTLNGASDTLSTDEAFFASEASLSWGSVDGNFDDSNPQDHFEGKMFDMRLVKGKALYTSTFTPPAIHLPDFGSLMG